MKAIRLVWAWFVPRWRHGSTLVRIVLAFLLPATAVIVICVAVPYELIRRIDSSARIPEVGRWTLSVVAFLIVVGVITAIGSMVNGTQSSSPTASLPSPSARPQPSTSSTIAPTAQPLVPTVLNDAAGDLKDANGDPAPSPAYMDLLHIEASSLDGSLKVQMELADRPPLVDPLTTEVSYGFFIDVNNDGEGDFQVLVSNFGARGQYEGSISVIATGNTKEGPDFPGDVTVAERLVSVQLPFEAFGNPPSLQVAAFSEWIFYRDPAVPDSDMVTDQAPDVIWPDAGGQWMPVKR